VAAFKKLLGDRFTRDALAPRDEGLIRMAESPAVCHRDQGAKA
jgi:hypothetical protein